MPPLHLAVVVGLNDQNQIKKNIRPPPPPSLPPKPKDWDNWRSIITSLWQTSPTYNEIRIVMNREYGFTAGLSKFKEHFKRWKLYKNATRTDVLYMGMVMRDRSRLDCDQSKRPTFLIHGRQFNYYDVQRSMQRWRISLDPLDPTPPKPSHIQIVEAGTPPPGGLDRSPQPEIPRSVAVPLELGLSEKILSQTDYMYRVSFNDARLGSKDLKNCQRAFGWGLTAVHGRDYTSAMMHFNDALDYLKGALGQKSDHLLPLIYVSTAYAHVQTSLPARGFLQGFFRHSLDLIREYYGEQHPFVFCLEALSRMQSTGQICVIALRKSLDLLYARYHGHTETIEEMEIMLSDTLRVLGEKTEALSHCRKVVRHREKAYPLFDPKILSAQNNLICCYSRYRYFDDAETILASVVESYGGILGRWPRGCQYFELLRLQALVVDAQGRHQETEKLVSHAIRELMSHSLDLENVETILHSIARMMNDINNPAKAKWVRTWIPRIKDLTTQQAWEQIRECLINMAAEYFFTNVIVGGVDTQVEDSSPPRYATKIN